MKMFVKTLAVFLLTMTSIFAAFGQKTEAPKSNVKTAEKLTFEREKFDPARNAADDLKQAQARAAKENKRIVLDIGGEWCGWCVYMDKFFAANAQLKQKRDENFVWVKINFSPENENAEFLSAFPAIKGYPHLFVLDAEGKLLHSQDTSELEEGKGYNLQRFTEFLEKWSPAKTAEK